MSYKKMSELIDDCQYEAEKLVKQWELGDLATRSILEFQYYALRMRYMIRTIRRSQKTNPKTSI